LLQTMAKRPEGQAWERTFSVAGVRGTLSSRMTGADTVGRFFGKTGTLNGVIATSGYLDHRHLGRRLLFGMLMNNVANQTNARTAHDKIIQAYAADLLSTGSRPSAPELESVTNDGNGATVTIRWTPATGASGYLVWSSADAMLWKRELARRVTGTSHVFGGLTPNERVYIRVSAFNDSGESDPSDVYGTKATKTASTILIVDGNDRWQRQPAPENTTGGGHDFVALVAEAIETQGYDTVTHEAVIQGQVPLKNYGAVLWHLGEEGSEHRTFELAEQQAITAYLQQGGSLFVSGAEIGYDLMTSGIAADQTFLQEVLRAQYLADDAETFVVKGSGGILQNVGRLGFYTPDRMVVSYPDQIAPTGGSKAILSYDGGLGGTAGIQYEGAYRLVYFGFPFESIDAREERRAVMSRVLGFLLP